jgi:pyruvate/2-oxoglutarate dehydrogenase complex dihydrolipoamide acyltransferase (E2) component
VFKGLLGKTALMVGLAVLVGSLLVGCGGGASAANQQEIALAERHGRQEKAEKEKERKLEREIQDLKSERVREKEHHREHERERKRAEERADENEPAPTPAPSSAPESGHSSCGGSLAVGPDTTCPFAENVEREYYAEVGEGEGEVFAYSAANDEYYEMFCTGAPHECTGAISAKVYFP